MVLLRLFSLMAAGLVAQEEPTFRSQTNLVLVPTLVRDSSDHAVYGLQAKDFILEDNGVPQTVHLDEQTQAEPLSIVVAVLTGNRKSRLCRISSRAAQQQFSTQWNTRSTCSTSFLRKGGVCCC
jgi:hypothetical protein